MRKLLIIPLALLLALGLAACNWGGSDEAEYIHVGPNWDAIHKLKPSKDSFTVKAKSDKTKMKEGEKLNFSIKSEKDGRLWIVQVDPKDNMSVLFPMDDSVKNDIKAGKELHFPPDDASWEILADKPYGKSILAFIVTTGETDLSDALRGDKVKSLQIVEQDPAWGVSKLVLDVEKKEEK